MLTIRPRPETCEDSLRKQPADPFADLIEQFLLSRRVGNCTSSTLGIYESNLRRFAAAMEGQLSACNSIAVQRYLTSLRERMNPVSAHQHFRTLKTFFAWCHGVGLLAEDPTRALTMKCPKVLPRVPEDEEVRRLLAACPGTFEGRRNRALIALLADSGLRVSEALRLRVEDLHFPAQTIRVRSGKGQKDGTAYFGATTALHLRAWLQRRPQVSPQDWLFCTRAGTPLTRSHALHILHRLSAKAGLPSKIGPHALRHFCATALLRRTGNLELVRQVLRHETLTMTLRYARLVAPEVAARFRQASPLDRLGSPS